MMNNNPLQNIKYVITYLIPMIILTIITSILTLITIGFYCPMFESDYSAWLIKRRVKRRIKKEKEIKK